jgi:GNAT superfamily N-acetyltransferase
VSIEIKLLRAGDEAVLANVAPQVFDGEVDRQATTAFLADERHHIVVAVDDGVVVGFASAVHYFHPDKPVPELFVNEVGVCPSHQGRGIARRIISSLCQRGRELGCVQAWVLTDRANPAAMHLYAASGGVEGPVDQVMFSFDLAPHTA